jgi:hypothetical protein
MQWYRRADHCWRATALFCIDLPLDERRTILSHFVSLLVDEESMCKLPSIFCSALVHSTTRVQRDAFRRFETHWRRHGYRIIFPLPNRFDSLLANTIDPTLIEDHGEASHFIILNLLALLYPSRHNKKESLIEAVLLTLAKRFNHGDIVWFYVKHTCALTAENILSNQIDRHSRSLLLAYFLTLKQSEQLTCTVLKSPFDSRTVSLYRLLVTLFLADNEIAPCSLLFQHVEKTIGVTSSNFYLSVCQKRYPSAYRQMIEAISIKS